MALALAVEWRHGCQTPEVPSGFSQVTSCDEATRKHEDEVDEVRQQAERVCLCLPMSS